MGTDIHGWVEYLDYAEEYWWPAINAGMILDRDYSLFGSLFGVRNMTDFAPVASGRGLPEDVSDIVREAMAWEGNHSPTWVSWAELEAVDWAEVGLDGIAWAKDGETSQTGRTLAFDDPRRRPGETWTQNGLTFRIDSVTRRQLLKEDGELLLAMMQPLAARYGGDHVRLIVWFDN